MAQNTARSILRRQLDARRKLWPELTDDMLWSMDKEGWVALPRLMPLILSIMDDLSGKGFPVLRTWKDRMKRLANLGFIGVKPGPLGDLSYAVIYNPYHVVKRAYLAGQVHENKWQALVIRANEVSAFDVDDIDDEGKVVVVQEEEDDNEDAKPAPRRKGLTKAANPRSIGRRAARG